MVDIKSEREVAFRVVLSSVDMGADLALSSLKDAWPAATTTPLCILVAGDRRVKTFVHRPAAIEGSPDVAAALEIVAAPDFKPGDAVQRLLFQGADAVLFRAPSSDDRAAVESRLRALIEVLVSVAKRPESVALVVECGEAAHAAGAFEIGPYRIPVRAARGDGPALAADVLEIGALAAAQYAARKNANRTAPSLAELCARAASLKRTAPTPSVLPESAGAQSRGPAPERSGTGFDRGRILRYTLFAILLGVAALAAWYTAKRL